MMRSVGIYLARHCTTRWNLENRLQGVTDVPLSAEGRVEAKANIPNIERLGIGRIVSSDLKRAHETARIYAHHLGLPVHLSPQLRELDHGDWEGSTIDELSESPTGRYRKWLEDPTSVSIPGGSENVVTAQRRIVEAISRIALGSRREIVLVVTHKIIRSLLQCALLGIDIKRFRYHIEERTDPIHIPMRQIRSLCRDGSGAPICWESEDEPAGGLRRSHRPR